jgi:hypothetical protein
MNCHYEKGFRNCHYKKDIVNCHYERPILGARNLLSCELRKTDPSRTKIRS